MLNQKFTNLQRRLLTIRIVCLAAIAFMPLTLPAQVPPPKPCFDFTGTGRTSFATTTGNGINGANIVWNILSNGGDGSAQIYSFGLGGNETRDGLAPGYYDSDNRADAAVVRNSNPRGVDGTKTFYIRPSTLAASNPSAFYGVQWGLQSDIAAGYNADYDGDGRDDLTVFRRDSSTNNLVWFILRSNTNTFSAVRFGLISDIAVTGADYNGDGRAEITVIRTYPNQQPARSNTYFAGDSNTGALVLAQDWGGGGNSDVYVIGDYLGDRRADFAVARMSNSGVSALNATWYILENGGSGQIVIRQFGYGNAGPTTDLAVCGDYNGDGKQDIAVYRPSNITFYWLNSPDFNSFSGQQWGQPNSLNLPIGILHTFNR
jgi:hypothetical protein